MLVTVILIIQFMLVVPLLEAQTEGCPEDMSHFWKFDEAAGPAYSDLYGSNAACTNCPIAGAGIIGGSQQFDGIDDQLTVAGDNSFDWTGTDSFTVELWINKGTACTNPYEIFIGRNYSEDPTTRHWWLGCDRYGRVLFQLIDTNGSGKLLKGPIVNDGQWHHVAGVRDNASGLNRLYVDGEEAVSAAVSYSGTFDYQTDLTIGWLDYNGYFRYNGALDEAAVYNKALSDAEIRQHFADGVIGLRRGYCACDSLSDIAIMPLGDSITLGTYGTGELRPIEEITGYRAPLYFALEGYYIDFTGGLQAGQAVPLFDSDHEGHTPSGGITAAGVASNVYSWLEANPADVVLLHIGTNGLTPDTSDVEAILDEIDRYENDHGKTVTVVLAKIINSKTFRQVIRDFNNNLQTMAQSRIAGGDRIIVVDQERALTYPDDVYEEFHPNDSGYSKMAGVWMNALDDFLPVCGPASPVILSLPYAEVGMGGVYRYDVDARGNPSPTYGLTAGSAGMTVDDFSGIIQWMPDSTGLFDISVEAVNPVGVDSQSYSIGVVNYPPGITHYWKLDETADSLYHDHFLANHASCVECPVSISDGRVGSAKKFDGIDDEVSASDDNTFDWPGTGGFTIELWIKKDTPCDTPGLPVNEIFIGRKYANDRDRHWFLGCDSAGVMFQLIDTDGSGKLLTGPAINDGNWHHLAGVRDNINNINRLYIDGAEVAAGAPAAGYTGSFNYETKLNIGWLDYNSSLHFNFDGVLDEVALYNRALTPVEIELHFNDGMSGAGYRPVVPDLVPDPDSHNFGQHEIGSVSGAQLFNLVNAGAADLNDLTLALTGADSKAFSVVSDQCSGKSIGANESCAVSVAFAPEVVGAKNGNLLISSSNGGTKFLSLQGDGIFCPISFGDVSGTYWAGTFIRTIACDSITSGCSGGNYCPEDNVSRAQMAVFLLKALGEPPAAECTGMFGDVSSATVGDAFCKYIEQFATLGITAGCSAGNYCPNDPVTRAQMAVFITKALGEAMTSTCSGTFSDVDETTGGNTAFCQFIEKFATLGITAGCGNDNYCPSSPVTRAQMAVFLTKAFLQ
jgi:hypothetical protein